MLRRGEIISHSNQPTLNSFSALTTIAVHTIIQSYILNFSWLKSWNEFKYLANSKGRFTSL